VTLEVNEGSEVSKKDFDLLQALQASDPRQQPAASNVEQLVPDIADPTPTTDGESHVTSEVNDEIVVKGEEFDVVEALGASSHAQQPTALPACQLQISDLYDESCALVT
jgi:hypothetical protein